jgi:hypothetical protein
VFQLHVLSISSFLYVESVAYECFKSKSGVAHELCMRRDRSRVVPVRATIGGMVPVWPRDAGVDKQTSG